MIDALIKSFIMIFAIMNAFGAVPIFLTLTKGFTRARMKHSANRAVAVAGIIILIFIFLGKPVLDFFSITLSSFKIAGGLILLILGITYILDISHRKNKAYSHDITVPMATPLIAGPGVITSVIILVAMYGFLIPLIAAVINLLLCWVLMYFSEYFHSIMGEQGAEVISKIMGLMTTAIAVEFIVSGVSFLLAA